MIAPLPSGPGSRSPGRPVRLQGQAHRAGRHRGDQRIEQRLGADAALGGERLLGMRELVLEPAHQPEAALDVDLGVEGAGQRRRIRRQQALHLDVLRLRRVDRRRGAEREVRGVGLERAAAEHLARLVGGGGDQRQARGQAELGGRGGGERAEPRSRRHEPGQLRAADRERLPVPFARPSPTAGACSRTAGSRPGTRPSRPTRRPGGASASPRAAA